MAKLNQNQEAVVNFLNNNSTESFSATQIGVAVGKKNPKNASTWAKPILEELVSLGLISQEVNGSKTTFSKLEKEVYSALSDEEVMEMSQEEYANPASVFTEDEIENAMDANDYAQELISRIKNADNLKELKEKEAYNKQLDEDINNAIEAYENEEEIPTNFYNEVVKIVRKELKFTAPKKAREPRINIFTGVDQNEALEVAKKAIKENEEAEDDDKKPVVTVVRESILQFLEEEYGFNETSLEDKRTRAFIYKIKQELSLTKRSEDVVLATEETFEKGEEVEFSAHRLTGRKGEVLSGTVVRTFFNDFGFRYVVIKSENKTYTKRDKDVVKK